MRAWALEGSRNLASQKREEKGIVYFDRGRLTGRDGRSYDRFAIQTHFVEVGEDQAELVRRYVLPLYQPGDVLAFGAKVMAMCTGNVRTKEQEKPGFWARLLSPHASETTAGIGMHDPYKLQLITARPSTAIRTWPSSTIPTRRSSATGWRRPPACRWC